MDLGREAKKANLHLKQNYRFVAKNLLIKASGYAHARQFNRLRTSNKQMKNLLIKLRGRIENKLSANNIEESTIPHSLKDKLNRSTKLLVQTKETKETKETKDKLLVWHAPEVECIGKGKARAPFEFGCKVSLTTNVNKAKGGHFILASRALHGRPYDGHTLRQAIEDKESITGVKSERIYVDKSYKGHDYDNDLIVFKFGQRRGVHGQIKRELKRRSAIEPIIGHAKSSYHLGRHRLKRQLGDKINAIFAAIGFNLRQVLNFIKKLCHAPVLAVLIIDFLLKTIKPTNKISLQF